MISKVFQFFSRSLSGWFSWLSPKPAPAPEPVVIASPPPIPPAPEPEPLPPPIVAASPEPEPQPEPEPEPALEPALVVGETPALSEAPVSVAIPVTLSVAPVAEKPEAPMIEIAAPQAVSATPPAASMTEEEIVRLDALVIAEKVRRRELSPVQVVEAHLKAIERANPKINAVCTLAAEQALETARRQEDEINRGRYVGPLAGVPVGIKDITPTAGIRTTFGSALYADNVPSEDALVVQRLKDAGCIVIGKTNTPEFAAGANTNNAVFGPTRNPWNTALSASGSTGGGAAGLRAGMFPLAEGSDLGGSLRTPAAFCGVVGLRPSPGLIPRHPVVAPWATLSVAGPMARSVTDTAAMLQVMAGPSPYSPIVVPVEGRDFVAAARGGIKRGLRVAYCPDIARIGVDTEIADITRKAALQLADAGASVEEIDLDLSAGREAFIRLRGQLMVGAHLDRLGKIDKLGPNLAGNIRLGLAQSPRDVALGERGQAEIFHKFRVFFEKYDALVTPCTAVPPFPVERNYPEAINGQPMKTYIDWVAPTFCVTLAGLPAISVPCGFTAAGLPVGLQIVGPRWGEEIVLGAAKTVEESHPVGWPTL